jgi:type IV pilus assembly protein PilX
MNRPATPASPRTGEYRDQRGVALVVASMLLLIVTLLGVAGLAAASLELRMSGNFQYQDRAFQAAEFAIEQALHSEPLSTAITFSGPRTFPASGIEALVPGSATDTYSYRLYFDSSAGGTPIPRGSEGGTAQIAYHFVIEGTGRSSRGAEATHTQGFYVLASADCDFAVTECIFVRAELTKTYWIQQSAE